MSCTSITCFGGAAVCWVMTPAVGDDNNLTFFVSSAALAPSILSTTCFFCKQISEHLFTNFVHSIKIHPSFLKHIKDAWLVAYRHDRCNLQWTNKTSLTCNNVLLNYKMKHPFSNILNIRCLYSTQTLCPVWKVAI